MVCDHGAMSHAAGIPRTSRRRWAATATWPKCRGRGLAGADAETQARQIFANLETLLAAQGAGPEHLVKLLTLVAGTEHLPGHRAAQAEAFAKWFPDGDFPAQSLAVVAALAGPDYTAEVEAVAAVPAP